MRNKTIAVFIPIKGFVNIEQIEFDQNRIDDVIGHSHIDPATQFTNNGRFWLANEVLPTIIGGIPPYPEPVHLAKIGGSRLNGTRRLAESIVEDDSVIAPITKFGGIVSRRQSFGRATSGLRIRLKNEFRDFNNMHASAVFEFDKNDLPIFLFTMRSDTNTILKVEEFAPSKMLMLRLLNLELFSYVISHTNIHGQPITLPLINLHLVTALSFDKSNLISANINFKKAERDGVPSFNIYGNKASIEFSIGVQLAKVINWKELEEQDAIISIRDSITGDVLVFDEFIIKNIESIRNDFSAFKMTFASQIERIKNISVRDIPFTAETRQQPLRHYINEIIGSNYELKNIEESELDKISINNGFLIRKFKWDALIFICEILRCSATLDRGKYLLWR